MVFVLATMGVCAAANNCRNGTSNSCTCGPVCSSSTGCLDIQCKLESITLGSSSRTMYNYTAPALPPTPGSSPAPPPSPTPYTPPAAGVYMVTPGFYCDSNDYQLPITSPSNDSAGGCISVCRDYYGFIDKEIGPDVSFLFYFR